MSAPNEAALRARARAVIPNGMYGHQSVATLPDGAPQFFTRARGAYLWDADGKRYIDFMCGYGPNLLGYGHEEIDAAFCAPASDLATALRSIATSSGDCSAI